MLPLINLIKTFIFIRQKSSNFIVCFFFNFKLDLDAHSFVTITLQNLKYILHVHYLIFINHDSFFMINILHKVENKCQNKGFWSCLINFPLELLGKNLCIILLTFMLITMYPVSCLRCILFTFVACLQCILLLALLADINTPVASFCANLLILLDMWTW